MEGVILIEEDTMLGAVVLDVMECVVLVVGDGDKIGVSLATKDGKKSCDPEDS